MADNLIEEYEDEDDQEELLELKAGKTVIGTIRGNYDDEDTTVSILYGNVATPVINGNVLHLPEDKYMDMLDEFLQSEEGLKYRVPTGKEVNKAIDEMLTLQREVDKKREEQRRQEEEKRRLAQEEEERRLAEERAEEERLEAIRLEEEAKEEELRIIKEQEELERQRLKAEEDERKRQEKEARKLNSKPFKIALVVLTTLLLLSLAGNVYLFLTGRSINSDGLAQLNINGATYEVPLANVDVKDGETKIIIYGISSTNKNGRITNKAIPLGEFNLDSSVPLQ